MFSVLGDSYFTTKPGVISFPEVGSRAVDPDPGGKRLKINTQNARKLVIIIILL